MKIHKVCTFFSSSHVVCSISQECSPTEWIDYWHELLNHIRRIHLNNCTFEFANCCAFTFDYSKVLLLFDCWIGTVSRKPEYVSYEIFFMKLNDFFFFSFTILLIDFYFFTFTMVRKIGSTFTSFKFPCDLSHFDILFFFFWNWMLLLSMFKLSDCAKM